MAEPYQDKKQNKKGSLIQGELSETRSAKDEGKARLPVRGVPPPSSFPSSQSGQNRGTSDFRSRRPPPIIVTNPNGFMTEPQANTRAYSGSTSNSAGPGPQPFAQSSNQQGSRQNVNPAQQMYSSNNNSFTAQDRSQGYHQAQMVNSYRNLHETNTSEDLARPQSTQVYQQRSQPHPAASRAYELQPLAHSNPPQALHPPSGRPARSDIWQQEPKDILRSLQSRAPRAQGQHPPNTARLRSSAPSFDLRNTSQSGFGDPAHSDQDRRIYQRQYGPISQQTQQSAGPQGQNTFSQPRGTPSHAQSHNLPPPRPLLQHGRFPYHREGFVDPNIPPDIRQINGQIDLTRSSALPLAPPYATDSGQPVDPVFRTHFRDPSTLRQQHMRDSGRACNSATLSLHNVTSSNEDIRHLAATANHFKMERAKKSGRTPINRTDKIHEKMMGTLDREIATTMASQTAAGLPSGPPFDPQPPVAAQAAPSLPPRSAFPRTSATQALLPPRDRRGDREESRPTQGRDHAGNFPGNASRAAREENRTSQRRDHAQAFPPDSEDAAPSPDRPPPRLRGGGLNVRGAPNVRTRSMAAHTPEGKAAARAKEKAKADAKAKSQADAKAKADQAAAKAQAKKKSQAEAKAKKDAERVEARAKGRAARDAMRAKEAARIAAEFEVEIRKANFGPEQWRQDEPAQDAKNQRAQSWAESIPSSVTGPTKPDRVPKGWLPDDSDEARHYDEALKAVERYERFGDEVEGDILMTEAIDDEEDEFYSDSESGVDGAATGAETSKTYDQDGEEVIDEDGAAMLDEDEDEDDYEEVYTGPKMVMNSNGVLQQEFPMHSNPNPKTKGGRARMKW